MQRLQVAGKLESKSGNRNSSKVVRQARVLPDVEQLQQAHRQARHQHRATALTMKVTVGATRIASLPLCSRHSFPFWPCAAVALAKTQTRLRMMRAATADGDCLRLNLHPFASGETISDGGASFPVQQRKGPFSLEHSLLTVRTAERARQLEGAGAGGRRGRTSVRTSTTATSRLPRTCR